MQAVTVVAYFDIFKHGLSHHFACGEAFALYGLHFQGVEKAFGTGIVITVAFGTHAAAQLVLLQQGAVSMGAILAAPVRMHDDPFGAFAFKNSHLQGITHQVGGHAFGHCPTDGLTGEQVGDDRQIQPAFVCAGWSKRQGVVGLFPCLSSPNRTCTFQRIRLSIQAGLKALATSG